MHIRLHDFLDQPNRVSDRPQAHIQRCSFFVSDLHAARNPNTEGHGNEPQEDDERFEVARPTHPDTGQRDAERKDVFYACLVSVRRRPNSYWPLRVYVQDKQNDETAM